MSLKTLKIPCLLVMEKAADSSIFVNDGSFLERFKQRQQEEGKDKKSDTSVKSKSGSNTSVTNTPKTVISKATLEFKANGSRKTNQAPSSGKLAFSLKQKSKLAAPSIKLGEDEDEDENDDGNLSDRVPMKRPKLDQQDAPEKSLRQVVVGKLLLLFIVYLSIACEILQVMLKINQWRA